MNWNTIGTLVGAVAACTAAGVPIFLWIRSERRHAEVHAWANRCIEEMQTLALLTGKTGTQLEECVLADRLREIAIRTSYLIEHGRLFYKNEPSGNKNYSWKVAAYRGNRPLVLDQLLICSLIAGDWLSQTAKRREDLHLAARRATQEFVGLIQSEVGRARGLAGEQSRAGGSRIYTVDDIPRPLERPIDGK